MADYVRPTTFWDDVDWDHIKLAVQRTHGKQDSETMQWVPANDARIPQMCYQVQEKKLVNDWPVLDIVKRTNISATNVN